MSKLRTLNDVSGTQASAHNDNNDRLTSALENTLSRDGSEPNEMLDVLDMNNYRILNLRSAVHNAEPVTLAQAATIAGVTNPLSADNVGAVLYPRSAEEITAGVTPTSYVYPWRSLSRPTVRRWFVLTVTLVSVTWM